MNTTLLSTSRYVLVSEKDTGMIMYIPDGDQKRYNEIQEKIKSEQVEITNLNKLIEETLAKSKEYSNNDGDISVI